MDSRSIEVIAGVWIGWTFFLPAAAAICWVGAIAPAIARLFGVPLAFSIRSFRRQNHLTTAQYIFGLGTFVYGVGIFLLFAGNQFLQSLFGNRYADTSLGDMSLLLAISLVSGTAACWLDRLREAALGRTR